MLVNSGIRPDQIGVITPYNGQLELLRHMLLNTEDECNTRKETSLFKQPILHISLEGIEIRTVDGFQGGEKECIILSLVRSNLRREVGFLADDRRINVAVTRARRQLTVICDSDTCSSHPFLSGLISHISRVGSQKCVNDYTQNEYQEYKEFIMEEDFIYENDNENANIDIDISNNLSDKLKSSNKKNVNKEVKSNSLNNKRNVEVNKVSDNIFLTCATKIINNYKITGKCCGLLRWDNVSGDFILSSSNLQLSIMKFPSTLDAYQRSVIHNICEELNLYHQSIGEKQSRFIEVSITSFPPKLHTIQPLSKKNVPPNKKLFSSSIKPETKDDIKNISKIDIDTLTTREKAAAAALKRFQQDVPVNASNTASITSDDIILESLEKNIILNNVDDNNIVNNNIVNNNKIQMINNNNNIDNEDSNSSDTDEEGKDIDISKLEQPQPSNKKKNKKKTKLKKNKFNFEDPFQASVLEAIGNKELDEMDILEQAINANLALQNHHKYRVSSGTPLTNPYKEDLKNKLHSKILESQKERRVEEIEKNPKSKKKVLLKPSKPTKTLVFGGGKLGTI
jgi:hypothetical protein